MLALVAHEQHAVLAVQTMEELVHLFRACQARFVEHVKPLLSLVGLLLAAKMPLQSLRLDARFCQLVRRAGRRRKPAHFVAFMFGGFTDSS